MRPDSFDVPPQPSSTIENPDWESFDEIETYVTPGDTGLLEYILPRSIWNYLFVPVAGDTDTIRQNRDQVQACFKSIAEIHAAAQQELGTKRQQEQTDTPNRGTIIYPATASPLEEYNSLNKYIEDAEKLLESENAVLHSISHLLDRPEKAFLRPDEQETLNKAQKFFKESVDCGSERLEGLRGRRQEIVDQLDSRVNGWKNELDSLERQAKPYIELDEYLEDEDVLASAKTLLTEIRSFSESYPLLEQISHPNQSQFTEIDHRVNQLKDDLQQSRSEYAEAQFTRLTTSIREDIQTIRESLERSQQDGKPIRTPDKILSQIQDLQDNTNEFRNEPFFIHLTSDQSDELSEIEETLEEFKEFVHEKERYDSELADHLQTFASLSEEAEPYLELDEYLEDDDLLVATEKLKEELSSFPESYPLIEEFLESKRSRFTELSTSVQQLNQNLRQSRLEYTEAQFNRLITSIQKEIQSVEKRLEPSQLEGKPIQTPDKTLSQIQHLQDKINEFRDEPFFIHLASDQSDELSEIEETLEEFKQFVHEKQRFDSQLADHTQTLESLSEDAEPYLENRKYLTQVTGRELFSRLNKFKSDIQNFVDNTQFSILSQPDADRANDLRQRSAAIRGHLQGYNSEFIQKQRDACAELFSNVGPNELDLTTEQERAVIRNGTYNQVIAAAGTGKTVTLTTRVAYLIKKQNIDPSDILVVTYTNEATNEMAERLEDHFGITEVPVKTIHSFGNDLIQETQEQFVESIDQNEQRNFIDRQIREARGNKSSEFLDHYYEFLVHFDDVYHDEADFETRKAYVQARLQETYVTLKGTEVKSRAEKLIADFLFTHQVKYRYEERATWAESAADKAGYTPDFYLPNHEIYIEHWGIDESGSVAPWFSQSSAEYREKIQWAQQQFTDTEHRLIGTYEFEHESNRLKRVLRHRLTHHGVELNQLGFEELIDTAFEYEQREGWIKNRFASFIENAKRFEVKPADITAQLSEENPRQYHFGHCGIHLLRQYDLYLTQNGLIDFQDMVHGAVDTIKQNPTPYKQRYEHLLVDEFQDIGKGKIELIQELTGEDAAKLFAVGDDWQSIYSFQGAVVDYFTEFSTHFGDPVRTDLTINFRSPATPVAAGNRLIEKNTNQLDKTVQSTAERDHTPRVHALRGYQFYDYLRRVRQYAVNLVREYIAAGAKPDDIMILCRFDAAVPYLSEIKDGLESQEIPYVGKSDQYRGPDGSAEQGVSVYSLYQAKGREAEHVILVHVAEGPYGFPPNRRQSELLDPVKPLSVGGIEEERRAFYVAVTRTKRTLDLLTRGGDESEFLEEIDEYTETIDAGQVEPLDDIGQRMTVTVEVEQLKKPWRKQHQRGDLVDRYGGSALFVSWASGEPPTLEEGEWYRLTNLKVGEYKGQKELVWTPKSSIQHLPSAPAVKELASNSPSSKSAATDTDSDSVMGESSAIEADSDMVMEGSSAIDEDTDVVRDESSAINTDSDWIADKSQLSESEQPPKSAETSRNDHSLDSVTDHHLYQEVLSAIRDLGGRASTTEIVNNTDIGRIEALDRLQTLKAEGKVTGPDENRSGDWQTVE